MHVSIKCAQLRNALNVWNCFGILYVMNEPLFDKDLCWIMVKSTLIEKSVSTENTRFLPTSAFLAILGHFIGIAV